MIDHVVMRFDAPLMSFGGVMVDNIGVTDDWPCASMLTGLIGNALGYRRTEAEKLQRLQDHLIFSCRADRQGQRLVDFQTVDLNKNDRGWTTSGEAQGRSGGANTYDNPHLRYRYFWADRVLTVALRVEPEGGSEDARGIAAALTDPARPLFLGRKTCLPSAPLLLGIVRADSSVDALRQVPISPYASAQPHAVMTTETNPYMNIWRTQNISGRRNWRSGVHGGQQLWFEGYVDDPGTAGKTADGNPG